MKRGDIFLVKKGDSNDPKNQRAYVIVSRQVLIDSNFSTVICAPIFTEFEPLETQVIVGPDNGLKHQSALYCDYLVSIQKEKLTDYKGQLKSEQLKQLEIALKKALDVL